MENETQFDQVRAGLTQLSNLIARAETLAASAEATFLEAYERGTKLALLRDL
jgi:hypothetical protein